MRTHQPSTARPSFRIIAGRPISPARPNRGPTIIDAWRILRDEREAPRNPWFDASSDERLLAAAFADRVVFVVCLTIGLLLLADFVAPDAAAWIIQTIMVAR
jgi:hypothetical protein